MRVQSLKRSAGNVASVRLLEGNQRLKWSQTDQALEIDFSGIATGSHGYAVEVTLKP